MKTNQIMTVNFKHGVLEIGHKDMMGNLDAIFDLGNRYRVSNNMDVLHMKDWLRTKSAQDYIAWLKTHLGRDDVIKTTRGRSSVTKAHLYILLDAAVYLSPELKTEMYDMFIHGKLLEFRDESGDKFIALNKQLDMAAVALLDRPAENHHYINLAKIIKTRILGQDHPGWNYANPDQLASRTKLETMLKNAIKNKHIKSWDALIELAKVGDFD